MVSGWQFLSSPADGDSSGLGLLGNSRNPVKLILAEGGVKEEEERPGGPQHSARQLKGLVPGPHLPLPSRSPCTGSWRTPQALLSHPIGPVCPVPSPQSPRVSLSYFLLPWDPEWASCLPPQASLPHPSGGVISEAPSALKH